MKNFTPESGALSVAFEATRSLAGKPGSVSLAMEMLADPVRMLEARSRRSTEVGMEIAVTGDAPEYRERFAALARLEGLTAVPPVSPDLIRQKQRLADSLRCELVDPFGLMRKWQRAQMQAD